MFYVFSYTPSAADTAANPHEIEMHLSAGVIHQVDVLFQDGCSHEEFVQIFFANHQIWPTNRGEKFRGNATIISFRDFYTLLPGTNKLNIRIWTTLSADFKEIIVQLGVLPKAVLQPLSFEELINAITGKIQLE